MPVTVLRANQDASLSISSGRYAGFIRTDAEDGRLTVWFQYYRNAGSLSIANGSIYFLTNEYAASGSYLWLILSDNSKIVLYEDGSDNDQQITYLYGFVENFA